MAHVTMNRPQTPQTGAFQPYVPPVADTAGVHGEGGDSGRPVRVAVRRIHGLSGTAGRSHGWRIDSHRRARNLCPQTTWRVVDPREQHRADDRVSGRIAGRRCRLHHSRADLLDPHRPELLQLRSDHDADVCRWHPRCPDDGAAAARAHRQGARRAPLPRRDRVRRSARRRRARRTPGHDGLQRSRHRSAVEVAVVDIQFVPHGDWILDRTYQPVPERDPKRGPLA